MGITVGVCVPARDEVHTGFAFDFAKMVGRDSKFRCGSSENGLKLYTMAGTLIFDQREKLVDAALSEGCDYILFIDSDMRFPSDTIEILLSRNVPIVGVNAVTRRKPTLPTALNLQIEKDEEGKIINHAWHKIDSRDKEGIEPCTAVGGGVVMIHKDVFKAIPKPWYDVGWGSKGIIGEDVHFCVKALDNGFQTYVDHSLSKHIGHIGTYEYRWEDVEGDAVERHNSGK
jgi:glycosyltransferase involved in cell wall biosynthesis